MIVVWGSINLDLIFAVERLPAPGETVLGPAVRIEPGGKGANQAVAAALDGAAVVMAGAVGRDALAEGALAGLRRAGVDVSRVVCMDAATGCAAICTDTAGRNQIAVGSGANAWARAGQVEDALLGPGTTLVLQMECDPDETATLIMRARRLGTRIVLNLAPARVLDPVAIGAVDLLVVNEAEAEWLAASGGSGADVAALAARWGVAVVRTLGEGGAEWSGGLVPASEIAVVDTTAAGDCFVGVLAAALDRGVHMAAAMARATVAAGICCTQAGSQGSLPGRAAIDAAV